MNWNWRFAGLKTSGGNVLRDYLSRDVRFQARVDAFLVRLKVMPPPWPATYFDGSLGGGIGELRVDYLKVEYRFYGFFGPGSQRFTVIMISNEKKRQQKTINSAKKMKKSLETKGYEVEDYDV
jgi:putative component of toxin-antitoxin plasmid stabilization module